MYLILSEFEIHIYRKLRTEFFPIDLCPNSKGCGAVMTINQRKKNLGSIIYRVFRFGRTGNKGRSWKIWQSFDRHYKKKVFLGLQRDRTLPLRMKSKCKCSMSKWFIRRDVTKISSCRVNTTSRQGIKQLGISFGFVFILFSYESSPGDRVHNSWGKSPALNYSPDSIVQRRAL